MRHVPGSHFLEPLTYSLSFARASCFTEPSQHTLLRSAFLSILCMGQGFWKPRYFPSTGVEDALNLSEIKVSRPHRELASCY